jgi:hypothetical protein
MARIGLQVNLANRIKRVGNYTELYLCKKMFSYVCCGFVRIVQLGRLFWCNEYGRTVVTKKSEWTVSLIVSKEVNIINDTVVVLGFGNNIIQFTSDLRRLYNKLDFSGLYWCALGRVKLTSNTRRYF